MPTADLLPDVQIKRAAEQGIDFARVSQAGVKSEGATLASDSYRLTLSDGGFL